MDNSLKWLILVLLFLTWIFVKCRSYIKTVILAMKLKGPATVPLFGNCLLLKDIDEWFQIANVLSQQFYGSISRFWFFFIPFVFVYKPEHLKIIMSSSKVSDKNFIYNFFGILFCNGLLTLRGDEWKIHRKLIQPFFQTNLIEKNHFDTFLKYSLDIINELDGQKCVKIQNITNKYVRKILHSKFVTQHSEIEFPYLNLFLGTILGVDLESVEDTPFRKVKNFGIEKLWKPLKNYQSLFPEIKQSNLLRTYVKKHFHERISQSTQNNCLLDKLIEKVDSNEFTTDEAINEAVMFLIAGYDTVAITIITSLYHLAKNQNVQEKVYQEIQEVTSNKHSNNVTVEQINEMHYLGSCIKETLRIMPTIPIMSRVLTSDITLDNYKIPSGTNIMISSLVTHRLPETFTNPLKYDPDRFSKENMDKLPPYSYIPFSMGSRNCIGYKYAYLELKTIIACILRKYHLALREDTTDLSFGYRIALSIKGGVFFNITPRKDIVK